MSALRLATRYAKSLIDLAAEKGQLGPTLDDMKLFNKIFKLNREFLVMLKSPIINADKKMKVLEIAFKGKVDQLTFAFLEILVQKGREGYFPEIARAFIEQYNIIKGISPVRLTTSVEIDQEVKDEIVRALHKDLTVGDVELETEVDESLIGGYILHYQDKLFDASILRSLNDLRHRVEDTTYKPKL